MTGRLTRTAMVLGLVGSLMASAASAQEAEGPSAVQETYRDWIVSCETPQAAEGQPSQRVCGMRQELRQAEGNQLVLSATLQTQADGDGADLILVAPFGLLLSEPIRIDLAEAQVVEVPFRTCLPRGCIARTTLDTDLIAQMGAGSEAPVSMTTTLDQSLVVTVSLAGFSAAWARLQELKEE